MGARFTAASNQVIANSATTLVGFPLVMGCWVLIINTTGSQALMNFGSSANNTNFWFLGTQSTPVFNFISDAAGTASNTTSAIAPVVGNWYFVMGRSITATNRWIIVFDPTTGRVDQAQNTASNIPTIVTPRMAIGGTAGSSLINPSSDVVAEAWYMDADFLIASAASLPTELVRKLALEGPFSVPQIADDIVEYRALRSNVDNAVQADQYSYGENYSRIGATTWANPFTAANVPITDRHPPFLSPRYVRPFDHQTNLVI